MVLRTILLFFDIESDGGSRIQGYWVDKREVGTVAWQRVNASLCLPNQLNVSNLIEGRSYEFRVFGKFLSFVFALCTLKTESLC